ncbi:MAG: peptidoglycan DD-metalloendopeptidase family protein [Bacteroides sp.]|nr:peptidoglycan DD-metalloendopeptidase family protein [Roseburia sp.]MCM1347719.1 peptidoglycan DD-metalloendopeptidase family protein [Bacteroides sp.]MCM1422128.1 peptidoglycan DD-metalloendopeptidase family protein [Bacteroides sp.]
MILKVLTKTLGVALLSMVSVSASAQDLIARQAPSDKKLKEIKNVILTNTIAPVDLQNPAADIYTDWNNSGISKVAGRVASDYHVDLRGFCMPTPSRKVNSKFGPRWGRRHEGLDIKVYVGDTIRAAFDGKVRIVKFNRGGYGYYVVIRHPNGLETLYGHLSKQIVKENQIVKAGEPIGLGGNTGRSFGSHLHFETRLLGKPIDPAKMFDFVNQDITGDFYSVRTGTTIKGNSAVARTNASLLAMEKNGMEDVADVNNGGAAVEASAANNTVAEAKAGRAVNTSAPRKVTYRVKDGDNLYNIARRHGITVSKLCQLNNITPKTVIHKGLVLKCS